MLNAPIAVLPILLEFFCEPGKDLEWFAYWKDFCYEWLLKLGLNRDNLKLRDHAKEELSHYSNATTDIEFKFPFGWGELWGIADRTDFDLKQHMEHSKDDLSYFDPTTNEKYVPYCIEPSLGADRVTLAFLCDAYDEEEVAEGDVRTVLRFHPALAPVKIGILPLSKKLGDDAFKVYEQLTRKYTCEYDETGSIGKRYRQGYHDPGKNRHRRPGRLLRKEIRVLNHRINSVVQGIRVLQKWIQACVPFCCTR